MPTPSKFTADRLQALLEGARVGASRRTNCAHAGLDEATLRRWLERGQKAESNSRYRQFYEDFAAAEAEPNLRALAIVHRAIPDKPDLAWKFLERREPGYAPPMPHTAAVQTGPVLIQLAFGDGRPTPRDLIEGQVVDVAQTPAGPLGLADSTATDRDTAS